MWRVRSEFALLDRSTGNAVKTFPVEGTLIQVGRDPEKCHLRLNHRDVAPQHCTISIWPENKNGNIFLQPEGTSLVLLNGFKVSKAQGLHRGDVISIGPFDLGVVESGFFSSIPEKSKNFVSFLDAPGSEELIDIVSEEIDWFIDYYLHRPKPEEEDDGGDK